jgi:exosome complex exonuclease DIS3/RRP44
MIDDKKDNTNLTNGLRGLLRITRVLRQRRNDAGALTLATPELKFKLDNESQNPTDVSEYVHVDTHFMIEEFMLLANVAVAERLAAFYPSFTILRRHPLPKKKQLAELVNQMAKFGFEVSTESSKKLAESLDKAVRSEDP